MRRTTLNQLKNNRSYLVAAYRFLSNNRLVYAILSLYILGVVIGTLVVKNGNQDIFDELNIQLSGFINKRAEQVFLPAFLSSFTTNFLMLFLIFFLGFCAIAPPVILLIPVIKGLSLGMSTSYLYTSAGFSGILYAVQNLLPMSLISSFTIILACASSFKLSGIYFSLFSHKLLENSISDASEAYLSKFVVYTVLIFFSALIDGLCCCLFGSV